MIEQFYAAPVKGDYMRACLGFIPAEGHVMEFGVWRGNSLRKICSNVAPRIVWGFDSFEGLPEAWKRSDTDTYQPGHFSLKGDKIGVIPKNARLVKGFFDDTLPGWVEDNPGYIALIHIDSDLYSSAKTILDVLNPKIIPGTVIMFDELVDFQGSSIYPLWENGEWRALCEWLGEKGQRIQVLCRTGNFEACVRVI